MTMDYISKALTKFNLLFIIYATVMLLFWGILLLNSELIIVPIAVSFFIVYLCVKKIPEYSFWIKILRFYNNSELEEFIDKEYNNIKNVKEYNEKNKTTKSITSSRLEILYQAEKDIYMSREKFNKVKILLELKKLLEVDKKMTEERLGETF